VLSFIDSYRNKALPSPITVEVLGRAGVNDSLVPRTLKTLEVLGLIDDTGKPTDALNGLRKAAQADFQARLADVVRGAYAEVLQYVDPATDDTSRIADQFRHFEPIGQLSRMVTLFLGLCVAAGIISEGATRKAAANPAPRPARRTVPVPRREPSVSPAANVRSLDGGTIPPALMGVLAALPTSGDGWTKARRDEFVKMFQSVLDFTIPVQPTDVK
jgi:hypothetical protein